MIIAMIAVITAIHRTVPLALDIANSLSRRTGTERI
jgi:hypothetical protein